RRALLVGARTGRPETRTTKTGESAPHPRFAVTAGFLTTPWGRTSPKRSPCVDGGHPRAPPRSVHTSDRDISPNAWKTRKAAMLSCAPPSPAPLPRHHHFNFTHPLATVAAQHCRQHSGPRRRLGGQVACGPCWEKTIGDDERFSVQNDLPEEVTVDPEY